MSLCCHPPSLLQPQQTTPPLQFPLCLEYSTRSAIFLPNNNGRKRTSKYNNSTISTTSMYISSNNIRHLLSSTRPRKRSVLQKLSAL
mmetsp:Transcript_10303/g.20414  ORF Transcript_10303/g.20414 Transcript_10303/m.20414 type:complete len:87 (-) Transcript_10303:234-494(-)